MHIEILRLGHRLPRDERISTHVALVARAFGASSITYTGQHDTGLETSVTRICTRWGGKRTTSTLQPAAEGASGTRRREDEPRSPDRRLGPKTSSTEFSITYEKNPFQVIKAKKKAGFLVIHLTMYGLPIHSKISEAKKHIKEEKDGKVLIVVGSEAVPGEVYWLADLNLAVTGQPHSEVAALAITLDRLMEGRELEGPRGGFDFDGKIEIEPAEKGKRIIERGPK